MEVKDLATAVAPAARLPRNSPSCGTLAMAPPMGKPSIINILLSPSVISGMYLCIIILVIARSVMFSRMTAMFGSVLLTLKIDEPPIPSNGFTTVSTCSSMNSLNKRLLLVTKKGVQHSGNSVANTFSLQSLKLLGLFTTFTPSLSADSKT